MSGWEIACITGGVAMLMAATLLLLGAGALRGTTGLPPGQVLLSDTGEERRGQPLYSERYGLTGTPDYVVMTSRGRVPVEVKPSRTEAEPHESHLLQVLAYCLLIEESEGQKPPYGLLRYKTETFKVDYNKETRAYLLSVMEEMREAAMRDDVGRNHQVAGRCRACEYRQICNEAL